MADRGAPSYLKHLKKNQEAQAERVREWQDIAPIPRCKSPIRRNRTKGSLEKFARTYLKSTFCLPWSLDHRAVILKMQTAVLEGGLFALAMPRGSGKTSIAEAACLWAILHAHRHFIILVGADEAAALRMLASIKVELETNELLLLDFPEVCHPIRRLDRTSKRAKGQHCGGVPTYIDWGAKSLAVAELAGSKASGAVVRVAGLTASIRGQKHKRPDGSSVRPDLVIIDDPQSDEVAASPTQCEYRERVLNGAVLGMAGPDKAISAIMPLTVILPGDLADRMLDPRMSPRWNGARTKLLYDWPERMDLWEQYADLRRQGQAQGDEGRAATDFYHQHKAEMDQGARVAWAERVKPGDLSALQSCMNWWIDDPRAFAAEGQNEPAPLVAPRPDDLTPAGIMARVNRHARGLCPAGSTRMTAMVDIQAALLYWAVVAWADDFTGAVVGYGAVPEQQRAYFTLGQARPTLADIQPTGGLEAQLWAGLEMVAETVLAREWPRDGGGTLRIERCLVDVNWEQSTEVAYRFCRNSTFAAILVPSRGKGISAGTNPMDDWAKRPGERKGLNWVYRSSEGRAVRHVLYDSNAWKTFLAARLLAPLGSKGALTLFGDDGSIHRMLADHLCSEKPVRTAGRGRELDEWKLPPSKPDNHYLDVLTGCCVAASMQGAVLGTIPPGKPRGRPAPVSYRDLHAQARR